MNEDEGRRAMLAQPALESPNDIEPDFANPPNMNALANRLLIAALTITLLAVLVRIHHWVFEQKQLKGRLEAVLMISGFVRVPCGPTGFYMTDSVTGVIHRWVYIAGLLYNSAIAPVKVAILTEWMRIFSPQSRSAFFWLCQVILWLNVAYYIASTIVESMQCTPRQLIWDPTVKGRCLDTKAVEVLSSLNVASDIVLLVTPQLVIWRLKSGVISAIFRLVATQASLRSKDSTYSISPVYFWALGELTSVFVVYGLPAVPAAFAGAATRFSHCRTQWTQRSWTGRIEGGTNASDINPWREARTRLSKRYRNLDRNSLPVNTLETATTQCTSTIIDTDLSRLPESVRVVKTIEIRRDEIPTDKLGESDEKDIGKDTRPKAVGMQLLKRFSYYPATYLPSN
ncbi:hypothetical protein FHL15_004044 [Xylaria flabelliformis]|uniref:Rhodopsin domain-containing protein n=1 Tax=Xylaria flabelliformis TaxID=2512241 RepID=A0A553I426_9PEZI|nr:hypothetical protein FHL15_004044 [Xylaria flabelliformis]